MSTSFEKGVLSTKYNYGQGERSGFDFMVKESQNGLIGLLESGNGHLLRRKEVRAMMDAFWNHAGSLLCYSFIQQQR